MDDNLTCLSRLEIDSFVNLIVVGAELESSIELNAYTEDHLKLCANCRRRVRIAYGKAVDGYISCVSMGAIEPDLERLLQIVQHDYAGPKVRVRTFSFILQLIEARRLRPNSHLVQVVHLHIDADTSEVRDAASRILRSIAA